MANAGIFPRPVKVAIGTVILLATPVADRAIAQDRPAPVAEVSAAWVGFADDGIVSESLVGGAARWYLLPRISVGPEIVYLQGERHSHVVLTGNLTFDVLSPTSGRPRRVTPFVVVGGGLFRTREQFPTGTFTSSEGAFTAGGGVRALVSDRVTIGVDTRVGWELHLRIGGLVGVQLGR